MIIARSSLALSHHSYQPSLLISPLDNILCPHKTDAYIYSFWSANTEAFICELVFTSLVGPSMFCPSHLVFEMRSKLLYNAVLRSFDPRICSEQYSVSFCSYHLAFFLQAFVIIIGYICQILRTKIVLLDRRPYKLQWI